MADGSRDPSSDAGSHARPDADASESDGDVTVLPSIVADVRLRTLVNPHFVGADNAGGGNVVATATIARAWERFTLVDVDGGALESGDAVLLRAGTGQYVRALGGGGSTLDAAGDANDAGAMLHMHRRAGPGEIVAGDQIGLQTANGAWLSAEQGGGSIIDATGDSLDGWEVFVIGLGAPAPSVSPRQRVLDFFDGISGEHTLSGIENKSSGTPSSHTDEVAALAGKTPALWGIDFGFGAGAVDRRDDITAEAIRKWNAGAIVTFTYHACAPTRDEYCNWDQIGGGTPQTRQHLTQTQWNELFTEGTAINREWKRRLDILASHFQTLSEAGVAPVFRPFHEMNQCVFWWACNANANGSVRLWKYTHDYLVETKGLENIVWAWNIQDFDTIEGDAVTYNPGADYFDLATLDIYIRGYTERNYRTMLSASHGKPIGIGECQFIPSVETLNAQPAWTYFMLWPDFIRDQRNLDAYRGVFGSARVTTLDEMPGFAD